METTTIITKKENSETLKVSIVVIDHSPWTVFFYAKKFN